MAVRQLRYGDDEVLREKCREVQSVDQRIRELLDDMMDTLHSTENGAALAANQVGILRRLVVIDYQNVFLKLVNPEIIKRSGRQECQESCLSFPGLAGRTVRPERVIVKALNEFGAELILEGEGEMAKCFCHELDHLDGRVYLDLAFERYELE